MQKMSGDGCKVQIKQIGSIWIVRLGHVNTVPVTNSVNITYNFYIVCLIATLHASSYIYMLLIATFARFVVL